MIDKIQDTSKKFFEKAGVQVDSLEVKKEKESIYFIKIKSDDSALLIGNNGETLYDIRKILSIMLSHTLKSKIIARIEVNDYLEEKDKKLYILIDEKIQLCKKLGQNIKLPFFSAYERKKIHNYISEKNFKNIKTKSEGEGKERRLYICKIQEKMTIDIDGIEI